MLPTVLYMYLEKASLAKVRRDDILSNKHV